MSQITFDTPILKIEGLSAKFDVVPVSSSLAVLLGNINRALIVQELHYWGLQGYGVVIDGVRWFHKSIKEWIEDVFPTFTPWQLRKLMAELVELGVVKRQKLFTEHQIQNGDRFWWQPKNQTCYYSLDTQGLQKLAQDFFAEKDKPKETQKSAETTENLVLCKTTNLSIVENQNTKVCDYSQNNTKNTSIENISKNKSHPNLPCVGEQVKASNQEKELNSINRQLPEIQEVISATPEMIAKDTNNGLVEENINQNVSTNNESVQKSVQVEVEKPVSKPKPKTPKGTKSVSKRMKSSPWKDEGQFKRFYRALIQALPIVANARSPQGLAQVIIRQLRSGIPHSYWDDFAAGLPIGASTKPEWEIEPGVPYPMFIEYLTEKIIKGNNTQTPEQARNEVFRILSQPRQAQAFWGQFKRSVVNVSQQVSRDLSLGVSHPNTPVWTRERVEPTIEEAQRAGQRISAVNGSVTQLQSLTEAKTNPQLDSQAESSSSTSTSKLDSPPDPWTSSNDSQLDELNKPNPLKEFLSQRFANADAKFKGFAKQMPQVPQSEVNAEEQAQKRSKTHISQMSMVEINDYLTDPILRKEIMPQLWHSDYELIKNELGEIIAVEEPPDNNRDA